VNPITLLVLLGVTLVVGLVLTVMIIWHLGKHDRAVRARIAEARKTGRHETLSLHPVVDEGKCIGCEECVRGCPEEDVLLTYRNKAVVVDAAECVGHGVCERVCPVGAIILVMGTETRGVEIPRLNEFFETSVPGMYVVGELGGMGLIRNAIWQATQAVEHAAAAERTAREGEVDLLIVGAGPAGLAAALSAKHAGLRATVIEQELVGGAMMSYPRRKLVMTYPASLPGVGEFPFKQVEKEPLLAFWKKAIADNGITIEEGARLDKVEQVEGGFVAHTSTGSIRAARVPGEDRHNVTYRLLEPEQFKGMRVAVVGGGNAAVEAAMSLSAVPGTKVTLLHRDAEFTMARAVLVKDLDARAAKGRIEVLRQARLTAVEEGRVQIEVQGTPGERPNDFVFVMIGGTAPYALLTASGVDLEKKFGTPLLSPKT
jgi:thioredoxin reductase (NADPH)